MKRSSSTPKQSAKRRFVVKYQLYIERYWSSHKKALRTQAERKAYIAGLRDASDPRCIQKVRLLTLPRDNSSRRR